MSGPENPRVEVSGERLRTALEILSREDCPPVPGLRCRDFDGDCRRCWLEYLKGEEQ